MAVPDRDNLADALAAMTGELDSRPADAAPSHAEAPVPQVLGEHAVRAAEETEQATGQAHVAQSRQGHVRNVRDTRGELELKRTIIPILLTCGTLLVAGAALPFMGVVTGWAMWIPAVMIAGGVVLLGLAVLNMLQVRDLMRK